MNDDRKFKERAELVKQLLLARISPDVIAKIANISESTVSNDRARITKLYGIKVPNSATTTIERRVRFRLLLKTFLKVKFETHNRQDPLYKAAILTINFEKIENHIYTIESLFERLKSPRFASNDQMAKNYQKLIEDCISENVHEESYPLLNEFYRAIHARIISIEEVNNEQDIIELATNFYCDKDRSSINTTVIDDPKALVSHLLPTLTKTQAFVIKGCYGLEYKKRSLEEISYQLKLSRERIRQIREKSLRIIRNELNKKIYLIHSTAKYNYLEQQYAELDKKYKKYCEETDQEILNLKKENAKNKGTFKENDKEFDGNDYYPTIQTLIQPIKKIKIPKRIINCLCCHYEYVLDIIENWDSLLQHRNFGKKSRTEIIDFLNSYGIDICKITMEEKFIAKQLIKRLT